MSTNGLDERTARAIMEAFVSPNVADSNLEAANVVDALDDIGRALRLLGNADAATNMGALEAHGKAVLESSERIAGGLHDVADAIRETKSG